jgi:cephalosporin-C deacetylase
MIIRVPNHHEKDRTMKTNNLRLLPQRLSGFLLLSFVVTVSNSVIAEDAYQLKVVTDHADAIYEAGQQAKFLVTVTNGKEAVSEGKVSFVIDDFIAEFPPAYDYPKGELNLDDNTGITATSSQPGFLRCRVSFQTPDNKRLQAIAAAAFSPLKIPPSLPVPDDFDEFWAQQKAQLAKVAFDAKLTPVKHADAGIECFDVQVACLGGAPVSGYVAKPKNAKPKSLPAILWVHGAGVRGSSLPNAVTGAKANMLSMDINAHGIPNGKPGKFYKDLNAGKLKNYRHTGRESRESIYFRGMYLRLVRAIDFLTSQPEWDGRVVAVVGHSQGGGQALVAGGLDDRVTLIATGVPAICDHSGRAAGRINGWPKLVPTESDGKPNAKILQAARYVDAVNFASRCDADAIMSVGFIDAVCPPSSCYAAYNLLQGDKQIINEPLMGHAAPQHIREAFLKRVQEHVRQKREK